MEKSKDKLSVFLSLVLRHKPEAAGIVLDKNGWANVEELIEGIKNETSSSTRFIIMHYFIKNVKCECKILFIM